MQSTTLIIASPVFLLSEPLRRIFFGDEPYEDPNVKLVVDGHRFRLTTSGVLFKVRLCVDDEAFVPASGFSIRKPKFICLQFNDDV